MDEIESTFGPRVIVELEEVRDEMSERAKAAGLALVTDPRNKPKSTVGRIIATGTDPLITEWRLELGTRVTFAPHAGVKTWINGKEYRTLELQEIINKLKPIGQ